mgnify:CR=1 FL=1
MQLLDDITHETPHARRRVLEDLARSPSPTYIYGAGVFAYVLQRYLEPCGIKVQAAMVDRAFVNAEKYVELPILTTEDNVEQLADANIIIGVTNYPPVVGHLQRLGARHVHVIDIPDYLNMPHPFMDQAFVREHADEFSRVLELFADDLSRKTYIASINCKVSENLSYVSELVKLDELYFSKHEFPLTDSETLLDVGGYTGDTVHEFHRLMGGAYSGIISLEPSPENFKILESTAQTYGTDRVTAVPVGAWDSKTTLRFTPKKQHIDNQITETGPESIEVDTIDNILMGLGRTVSIIKLDINGAEYRALQGARQTIQRDRPRIITRLHTKEDYYRIPLLLKSFSPSMKLYLRQRNYMSMMVVLYGLPS